MKKIRAKVKKQSKHIKTSHHIDHYYNGEHKNFLKPKYPYEWLTVRGRDGKILLNYKHWYPEGVKDTTHCDEYETAVDNFNQTDQILYALGFKEFVVVEKTREAYVHKDKIEIALDTVKELGHFMEVESLVDMGGPEKTHQELTIFLNSLGIKDTTTVPGGYAAEMMRKKKIAHTQ